MQKHLSQVGTPFAINPRMVRGLDYYTKTTFEMVTDRLGAQSAVAAGGRYDRLVADLGGPPLPGIGFAMGVERIALLLDGARFGSSPDLFIVALGSEAVQTGFRLMCDLQRQGVAVEIDYEGKSMKSQMRRADKLGVRYTVILGDDEIAKGTAVVRNMATKAQSDVALSELVPHLRRLSS